MGFKSGVSSVIKKIGIIGDAVIFRHSLFSLPFAVTAVLLETSGHPPLKKVILILLAVVSGRNAANALNRIIDADIDSRNPRTSSRPVPRGLVSKKSLALASLILIIILIISAALLNPLCVILLPLAGILIGGYSFTKRFTWLCHYWLGIACSCSVMGSFIALSGRFTLRYFVLTAAHALWVAGFDILYALPDITFDRSERLHSIPARFGEKTARLLAILSHTGTIVMLFISGFFWRVSFFYLTGITIAAIMLAAEHIIALGKTEHHIRIASYSINEILPLIVLAGTALDVYTGV